VYSRWANSLCLVASAFFDLTEGVTLLVRVWGQAVTRSNRPTLLHSYGFDRYEVIGRFGTASYFAFVCLWIFFEGVERILEVEPTFIHGSYLVQIGTVGLGLQLLHVTVFRKVRSAVAMSGSVAVGWEFLGDALVVLTGLAITYRGYFVLDTFVALFLTVLIAYQMIPVMVEMAMILMQATPANLPTARILREISTVEGVVEVRKEHFWATGPSAFVATLRVRVRKECINEAAILAQILDLVSPYVAHLTVQIEKDFL
jgi:zinc transporter 6